MFGYFRKFFSILLVTVVFVTTVAPSDTAIAATPAKPIFKVVKRAKKSVIIKINKTRNATGYQIFIANSKNGKYRQTAASRIRTVKITKLKKNKVYYIKVRAFKTVGYHITYGKFSKAVKIDKYGNKEPISTIVPEVPTGSAIDEIEDPTIEPEPQTPEIQEPEQTSVPDMDSYIEPVEYILAK